MISIVAGPNIREIPGHLSERRPRSIPATAGGRNGEFPDKSAAAVPPAVIVLLILFCIATAPILSGAEPDPRHAILLAGVSGDPDLQKMYLEELRKLHSILTGPLSIPPGQVTMLFDAPEMDPDLIRHKSTRRGLEEACLDISKRVKETDLVFVFIEGHGSFDGKTYKFNLVGPDTTAWELADILYSIPAGHFIVVNATSSSGGSLPALSGEGKIIITATKSGMEGNRTHMGGFFVESLVNNAADSNKDDRVSVLEAFSYASLKVEEYYRNEGNLQTEHSVLDDNGDSLAQRDPGPENEEGLLARTTFFDRAARPEALYADMPERQKLSLEAGELEKQIEALKYRKAELPEADYEKWLEELLLKLAGINAKLEK